MHPDPRGDRIRVRRGRRSRGGDATPPGARIDEDPLARQLRTGAPNLLLLADRVRRATGDARAEPLEGAQRRRTTDSVRGQSVFTLVQTHCVVGVEPEDAVDEGCVVAEVLETVLEGGNVVADHRRRELIREDAGTETVRGLPQDAVGRGTDDAVDDQTSLLLKRPNCPVTRFVENGVPRPRATDRARPGWRGSRPPPSRDPPQVGTMACRHPPSYESRQGDALPAKSGGPHYGGTGQHQPAFSQLKFTTPNWNRSSRVVVGSCPAWSGTRAETTNDESPRADTNVVHPSDSRRGSEGTAGQADWPITESSSRSSAALPLAPTIVFTG